MSSIQDCLVVMMTMMMVIMIMIMMIIELLCYLFCMHLSVTMTLFSNND